MGSVQLKKPEREDVEVIALFEPNKKRGAEALANAGLSSNILVPDYNQIINNESINTVWLVSPNSFHGPQAIVAMKSGKHVFCEKPAATNFDDYCTEIEIEKANPFLITYVDYILYFDSMEQKLREMIATGEFGQITQIQINYRHPINITGDKVWKLNKNIMGDAISMGINHAISVMVFAMSTQAKPISVYATSMPAKVRGFEADPIWAITILFDNGSTGFCFGNIDNGNGYDAFHSVYGTEGAFVFDSQQPHKNKIRYWSQKSTQGKWGFPLDHEQCYNQGLRNCVWPDTMSTPDSGNVVEHQTGAAISHFIDCIKANVKSPLSFANSSEIAEIGWASQISAILKKPVSLPLNWANARKLLENH